MNDAPKLIITPDGAQPAQPDFQGFDKTAPSSPPNAPVRYVTPGFEGVLKFIEGFVAEEGLVLDLCFERAIEIVETNLRRKTVGIDFFTENNVPPAILAAQLAAPMAVELYKQVLAGLAHPENDKELKKLVEAAKASKK